MWLVLNRSGDLFWGVSRISVSVCVESGAEYATTLKRVEIQATTRWPLRLAGVLPHGRALEEGSMACARQPASLSGPFFVATSPILLALDSANQTVLPLPDAMS